MYICTYPSTKYAHLIISYVHMYTYVDIYESKKINTSIVFGIVSHSGEGLKLMVTIRRLLKTWGMKTPLALSSIKDVERKT